MARCPIDHDRAVIDRLWNRFIAAWFQGGKDDPNLVLLRLDAERAEIWLDEHSLVAGVKLLLGIAPQGELPGQGCRRLRCGEPARLMTDIVIRRPCRRSSAGRHTEAEAPPLTGAAGRDPLP